MTRGTRRGTTCGSKSAPRRAGQTWWPRARSRRARSCSPTTASGTAPPPPTLPFPLPLALLYGGGSRVPPPPASLPRRAQPRRPSTTMTPLNIPETSPAPRPGAHCGARRQLLAGRAARGIHARLARLSAARGARTLRCAARAEQRGGRAARHARNAHARLSVPLLLRPHARHRVCARARLRPGARAGRRGASLVAVFVVVLFQLLPPRPRRVSPAPARPQRTTNTASLPPRGCDSLHALAAPAARRRGGRGGASLARRRRR